MADVAVTEDIDWSHFIDWMFRATSHISGRLPLWPVIFLFVTGVACMVMTVEGVPVTHFDTLAVNAVIHKLSGVMLPPSGSIVDEVASDSQLSTLLSAVQKAGLVHTLKGDHLTVFAPTNDAFSKTGSHDLERILGNTEILKEVLTYHVVSHTLYSAGLYNHELPHSAAGQPPRPTIRQSFFKRSDHQQ